MKLLKFTNNSGYPCNSGYFGLAWIDKKDLTVENRVSENEDLKRYAYGRVCLEEFNNLFEEDSKSIIFYHNLNTEQHNFTTNIFEFLKLIEAKLNLPKKSEVFDTDKKTLTPIRVSPFWLKNKLRRWIFTIMVRDAARNFKKNAGHVGGEIASIIDSPNCYCNIIKSLLNVFLEGYTVFDKKCLDKVYANFHHGPIHQFKNLTVDQIKGILLTKEGEVPAGQVAVAAY